MAEASSPAQVTPTSSLWAQLCFPQGEAGQSARAASVPVHPHVVQPDGAGAPAPKRDRRWGQAAVAPTAQLPADHGRVPQVPAIVTPTTVPSVPRMPYLQRPEHLLGPATGAAGGTLGWGWGWGTQIIPKWALHVFPLCIHPGGDPSAGPDALCSPPLSSLSGEGPLGAVGGEGRKPTLSPTLGVQGRTGGSPASGPELLKGGRGGQAELRHRVIHGARLAVGGGGLEAAPWAPAVAAYRRGRGRDIPGRHTWGRGRER